MKYMTYMDVLNVIAERKEKILNQDAASLITDRHRYIRDSEGWYEDTDKGAPEKRFIRGGEVWIWKREEAPIVEIIEPKPITK